MFGRPVVCYLKQKVIDFLQARLRLKSFMATTMMALLILAFVLPKELGSREADKLVFKEIGEVIAEREGNSHEIYIAASPHSINWISFYANLKYRGATCPMRFEDMNSLKVTKYKIFISKLVENNIRYFLWEEKRWPMYFFFRNRKNPKMFDEVGRWYHQDTGLMVLFYLK